MLSIIFTLTNGWYCGWWCSLKFNQSSHLVKNFFQMPWQLSIAIFDDADHDYFWQWCLLCWIVFPLIISTDHGIPPHGTVILDILRGEKLFFFRYKSISRICMSSPQMERFKKRHCSIGVIRMTTWADVWSRFEWKKRASPGLSSTNRCGNLSWALFMIKVKVMTMMRIKMRMRMLMMMAMKIKRASPGLSLTNRCASLSWASWCGW